MTDSPPKKQRKQSESAQASLGDTSHGEKGMKRTNFYFPVPMLDRLKRSSEITGMPVSEFIRRAVDAALKKLKL
ncbi:ribbon-helix-helix domain-containing protein [Paraburkholderia sp. T12-10]|nr:ribbon-helix-helix domain-containing protein [Paraburkholderia sp. T12-10]